MKVLYKSLKQDERRKKMAIMIKTNSWHPPVLL
jgi:hypothetical protein